MWQRERKGDWLGASFDKDGVRRHGWVLVDAVVGPQQMSRDWIVGVVAYQETPTAFFSPYNQYFVTETPTEPPTSTQKGRVVRIKTYMANLLLGKQVQATVPQNTQITVTARESVWHWCERPSIGPPEGVQKSRQLLQAKSGWVHDDAVEPVPTD